MYPYNRNNQFDFKASCYSLIKMNSFMFCCRRFKLRLKMCILELRILVHEKV